jgi:hypothetical protein
MAKPIDLPVTMEEVTTLDDMALTLREALRYYKKDLLESYTQRVPQRSYTASVTVLQVMGVELQISERLINQFFVEEALEQ